MAILRGAEAERWLAQNPGRAYKDLSTGQSVQAQPSAIMSIIQGITKPFRMGAGVVGEFGRTVGEIGNRLGGSYEIPQENDYWYLTEEEKKQLREDPLQAGLKAGAGIAAYGIPAGGGQAATTLGRIGTAAGRGAGSGVLAGFGASEEGEELQSSLGGGALGGLLGGAFQGVSEGARALSGKSLGGSQVGREMQMDAAGIKTPKNPQGATMRDDLFDEVTAITGGDVTPKGLNKAYSRLSKELSSSINRSTVQATSDDIANNSIQRLVDELGVDSSTAKRLIDSTLNRNGVGGMLNAKGLAALKKATQPNALRAQKIIEQGGSLTRPVYSDYVINSVADDILKSGLDDVGKSAYAGMAKLYEVAPDVITKADRAGHITVANLKVPTLNLQQSAQSGLGKILENVGSTKLPNMEGLANILPRASRAIPAVVGLPGLPQNQSQQPQGTGEMPQSQGPQLDMYAIAQAVLNGQISTTEAKFLMEMFGGSGGQMPKTESGRKAMVARDAAVNALRILQQDPTVAGKTQGIQNIFYDLTGQANTSTAYKAQLETLRSQVFNAMGGTSLTPTEREQYEKFLPKITDSPQQAAQKIQGLIPMLESLMGAEVPATSDSALLQILGL